MSDKKSQQAKRIQQYARMIEKQTGKAVRPFRADGYMNMMNRYGTSKDATEHYKFNPEPAVPDDLLSQFYEGNGLFAKIIDAPAEEALKRGFELDGIKDEDVTTFCYEALDELDWEETFMTAIKWSRLFGGSIIVMLINDGGGLEDPLNWKNIKSIDDLRVYDRSVIQPDYSSMFSYDPRNPYSSRGSRLGMPEYYRINSRYGSFTVHESRCLVFQNGVLPENTSNSVYQLWGMPEYVRIHKAIRDTEVAHSSAPRMLDRSVQPVYKMKDLSSLLATEEGESLVLKRLQVIDLARGLLNSLVIDSEGEDYDFRSFQFAGVSDVIDAACNFLSAITHIPQSILFGRAPSGMSDTGESDMEKWYSYVERIRKKNIKGNLRYLVSVIFQAGLYTGEVDEVPKIKIKFKPLKVLSDMEQADLDLKKAQIDQAKAQTTQIYVDMQVLDPSEVRLKLADSSEYNINTVLDEYEDEEDLMAAYTGQLAEAPGQQIFEEGQFNQYGSGVDVAAHDKDPGTEGSAPANAPAVTKLPQDMSAEEKEQIINKDSSAAGVGVLVVKDGKILCGTRHNDTGYGLICGPGGHVENGESYEKAAFRETEEEFGISPKELIPIGIGPLEPESGLRSHIFLCTAFDGEPDCVDMEMAAPKFRSLEELEELKPSLFPPFRDSLEILRDVLTVDPEKEDGGPGSGNHGHEGRAGKIGGSAPEGSNVGGKPHKPTSKRSAPAVKSKKSFDKYVEENGLKKIYRGFSAQTEEEQRSFSDSIKSGTSPVSGSSSSALGSGVYFSDKESEAKDYMTRRQNETGGKYGQVTTAALDVDARVADSNELAKQKLQDYSDATQRAFRLMKEKAPQEDIEEAIKASEAFAGMDISDYARDQGYDAIYESGTGYTVVVNQNALVVCDDPEHEVKSAPSEKAAAPKKSVPTEGAISGVDVSDKIQGYELNQLHSESTSVIGGWGMKSSCEQYQRDEGASDASLDAIDRLMQGHSSGGDWQMESDAAIEKHMKDNDAIGQALVSRSQFETGLYEEWKEAHPDSRQLDQNGELRVYRKGERKEGVESWTIDPDGADMGYGGIGYNHESTLEQLQREGYSVIAGFGTMGGAPGEGEITFVKTGKGEPDEKPEGAPAKKKSIKDTDFAEIEGKLLNGSDDDRVAVSPFKQLTAEEFEEVKKANINGVEPVEKTVPLAELYSTQPTNKMSRLQRVYEHFQDDPESLYENIARPAGFMETPNKTIRVYKINGKDVIADGNHRLAIMSALGDTEAKVEYYDLDKQK